MSSRSRTRYVLLGLLSSEPMTGYELKAAIERSVGHFWQESFGQLYPTLKTLEQEGWVRAKKQGESGRGRIVYAITPRGKKQLEGWLREPPSANPPRNELLLKLFFGRFADHAVVIELLSNARREAERDVLALEGLTTQLRSAEPNAPELAYWLLTVDLGRRVAEARAAWADSAIRALGEGDDEPA